MIGYDPSSPGNLHMYKHSFGNTSPDWSLAMAWASGLWFASYSQSLLISSSIYSFFPYGGTSSYVYMVVISLSNGSVNSRYKSSVGCSYVWGSGVSGDFIAVSMYCHTYLYLLMFNRAANVFIVKTFTGSFLLKIGLETSTNR